MNSLINTMKRLSLTILVLTSFVAAKVEIGVEASPAAPVAEVQAAPKAEASSDDSAIQFATEKPGASAYQSSIAGGDLEALTVHYASQEAFAGIAEQHASARMCCGIDAGAAVGLEIFATYGAKAQTEAQPEESTAAQATEAVTDSVGARGSATSEVADGCPGCPESAGAANVNAEEELAALNGKSTADAGSLSDAATDSAGGSEAVTVACCGADLAPVVNGQVLRALGNEAGGIDAFAYTLISFPRPRFAPQIVAVRWGALEGFAQAA
jgi:hypothetical protein